MLAITQDQTHKISNTHNIKHNGPNKDIEESNVEMYNNSICYANKTTNQLGKCNPIENNIL